MTTFTQAANALRKRFVDEFHTAQPEIPISFDNVERLLKSDGTFTDAVGFDDKPVPWVRFSVRPGQAFQASVGVKRLWRHPGTVIVQIFAIQGSGEARALEIADDVGDALRGVTVDGVRLSAPSPPQYVGPDGSWWQTNVTTEFEFDLIA